MPSAAPRPCTYPGCGTLTSSGRCPKHRGLYLVNANRRKPGERRVYDQRRWRDGIRPAQLRRRPLCEDCAARGLVVAASDVDHVDGDPHNNAPGNLRSRCHACHSRKTASTDGGFGNAKESTK